MGRFTIKKLGLIVELCNPVEKCPEAYSDKELIADIGVPSLEQFMLELNAINSGKKIKQTTPLWLHDIHFKGKISK